MFGKKKKKALTKQERRIASSVNTKPKKSFKQNKVNKTKVNDSKNKTNYFEKPIQGFYVDKVANGKIYNIVVNKLQKKLLILCNLLK